MPHSLRARLSGLRYKKIISDKDYDRLCKALDNEKILDNIKAEIEELPLYCAKFKCDDFAYHIDKEQVLDIIDKYSGYSPCDDCKHEGSFGKEFDDTCMQCKSGSNRTESR